MTRKPRVLLLSASSGAGHVRAGEALQKAFASRGDCLVEHIDAMQYVSKLFQGIYEKAYISMVRNAPAPGASLSEPPAPPGPNPGSRRVLDPRNPHPMTRLRKRA